MTIYSENGVPVLFRGPDERVGMSADGYDAVQAIHQEGQEALRQASLAVADASGDLESEAYAAAREAQAAVIDKYLLIGESVVIDNPDPDRGDFASGGLGASDLKEALQDTIGAFDRSHIGVPEESSDHILTPQWVASTHEDLAKYLADYYSCKVIPISEVPV